MANVNVGGKSIPLVIPKVDKTLRTTEAFGSRYYQSPWKDIANGTVYGVNASGLGNDWGERQIYAHRLSDGSVIYAQNQKDVHILKPDGTIKTLNNVQYASFTVVAGVSEDETFALVYISQNSSGAGVVKVNIDADRNMTLSSNITIQYLNFNHASQMVPRLWAIDENNIYACGEQSGKMQIQRYYKSGNNYYRNTSWFRAHNTGPGYAGVAQFNIFDESFYYPVPAQDAVSVWKKDNNSVTEKTIPVHVDGNNLTEFGFHVDIHGDLVYVSGKDNLGHGVIQVFKVVLNNDTFDYVYQESLRMPDDELEYHNKFGYRFKLSPDGNELISTIHKQDGNDAGLVHWVKTGGLWEQKDLFWDTYNSQVGGSKLGMVWADQNTIIVTSPGQPWILSKK